MTATFDDWTGNRPVPFLGTNNGASPLAFQSWHRFKEAFPPELVRHVLLDTERDVQSCLDPFGGSGTTALAAQFLGVSSTTIEINPFLVEVIRAKLATYDADQLARTLGVIRRRALRLRIEPTEFFAHTPKTFLEPGVSDRWLFDRDIAEQLASLLAAIDRLEDDAQRRLFRVLVGGILVEVSNVVVSGKGRRYRRSWKERRRQAASVWRLFSMRAQSAIADVYRFADRPKVRTEVLHGDARQISPRRMHDVAIFSPPYPNSFDYTDVYNVELWMLGYLSDATDNRKLRESTLTSHVQVQREFADPPAGSPTLRRTVSRLHRKQDRLWSQWIPAMVGGYFADLSRVLTRTHRRLCDGARCYMVVGDSRYGGVLVPTGRVLAELAPASGWTVHSVLPVRAMRSSAQQGGRSELTETLLVLGK